MENKKKHTDATVLLKEELSKLKDESRKLQGQKEIQDRKLSEF